MKTKTKTRTRSKTTHIKTTSRQGQREDKRSKARKATHHRVRTDSNELLKWPRPKAQGKPLEGEFARLHSSYINRNTSPFFTSADHPVSPPPARPPPPGREGKATTSSQNSRLQTGRGRYQKGEKPPPPSRPPSLPPFHSLRHCHNGDVDVSQPAWFSSLQ